ncbi:MAG: DUF4197 domain-containing protein [Rhodocyclaceae bacterium]|nr:DUF4197 domain-containing protein [Rhodocyclaceae bacterium]
MKSILRTFALLVISLPAWALGLADITDSDASGGLKEALTQGATQAVALLGKEDGFLKNKKVRIPLPDGLAQAEPILRGMGKGKDLDELVTAMNRAAEQAVPKAQELLVKAVREMSVKDAKDILTGGDDSVTRYFKGKTKDELTTLFLPTVKQTTDKLSLAKKYDKLASKAAGLGLVKAEDSKIEGYVTRKTLDGLYTLISEEEKAIRKNPLGAAGGLAKKVFGAL